MSDPYRTIDRAIRLAHTVPMCAAGHIVTDALGDLFRAILSDQMKPNRSKHGTR